MAAAAQIGLGQITWAGDDDDDDDDKVRMKS